MTKNPKFRQKTKQKKSKTEDKALARAFPLQGPTGQLANKAKPIPTGKTDPQNRSHKYSFVAKPTTICTQVETMPKSSNYMCLFLKAYNKQIQRRETIVYKITE